MLILLKKNKNKIILLSIIYLFSQWMLLIASGRWWDDWCFYRQPKWLLNEMALQLGRPSLYPILRITQILPENGYRVITFFLFYFCLLFTFSILQNWIGTDEDSCFWICALYATAPVNDARIMLAVFPYSLGLFFFMAGFCFLADRAGKEMKIHIRVISYVLFLCSFILNSNLVFYAVVLLMILTKSKNLKNCFGYIDFLCLPVVYFAVKNKFFPAYGVYENYNKLTFKKIINAVRLILPADLHFLKGLYENYYAQLKFIAIVALIIIISIVFYKILSHKNKSGNTDNSVIEETKIKTVSDCIKVIILGFIFLTAGLFPYVAIRQTAVISTVGVEGRDSVLSALGSAMILFGIVELLIKGPFTRLLFIVSVMSGIVFFSKQYLFYQQDYYRQVGFQYQLSENPCLEDAQNIIVLSPDDNIVKTTRFYTLNANAEVIFNRQNKLFIPGFNQAGQMLNGQLDDFVNNKIYRMSEYDTSHKIIDAVVEYNMDVGIKETLKIKMYEMMRNRKFHEIIKEQSSMLVYLNGTEEYYSLLNKNNYKNIE